jgi:flagellar motor switch/type III secretory pathway protein FliN
MIAGATFGPASGRVRPLRFARRSSIPLGAACVVASGIRETLRELLGDACEVVLGEPTAIGPEAWSVLTRDALLFLTRGRQTDIVLVLPKRDARRLVRRAFGEPAPHDAPELPDAACSVLEGHALERIAARCAAAFDPLCAERRGASQPVATPEAPACVAYFDVRVHAPIALTLGIGIVRDLPDPGPAGSLPPGILDTVDLELRAVFAEGTIDAAAFVALRAGDIVKLNTKVGAPGSLNVDGHRVASGVAGVIASRNAFCVRDLSTGARDR